MVLRNTTQTLFYKLKESSDFYDSAVAAGADPTLAANWLNTQVNGYLNENQVGIADIKLTPNT